MISLAFLTVHLNLKIETSSLGVSGLLIHWAAILLSANAFQILGGFTC
jgi:hypothetical protein